MRRVIVESPYAGKTPEETAANVEYARRAVRDCVLRGESPIASHLLFTQPGILRDEIPEERALGMKAGLAWGEVADAHVVYVDRGVTPGMKAGISRAKKNGKPVEERKLMGIAAGAGALMEHAVPRPEQLRDLLLAIGHDVTVAQLTDHAHSMQDVIAAAKWARAQLEHDQGRAEVAPKMPEWLAPICPQVSPQPVDKKAQPDS